MAAKIVLQRWINDNDIALFFDDAEGNFYELYDIAQEDQNEEIIDIFATNGSIILFCVT